MIEKVKHIWNDASPVRPAQAVLHPAWLMAVVVLIVNDHMLKPVAFAEPIVGKVSDFAGLFFFPVFLAALLGAQTRRGLWGASIATGLVFGLLNTSPMFAAGFDAWVSTVVPFATTVDPTDLIALIAIPAGVWYFGPTMRPQPARTTRRAVEVFALLVGGVASMATSEPCDEFCAGQTPDQTAAVSILNKSNELHVLRVRNLRAGMTFDCDVVGADPSAYLRDAAFDAPLTWFVQSGQEIPIEGRPNVSRGTGCDAVLVQSDTAPDIVVFWRGDLPAKSFAFDADVPQEIPADDQTVVLDADYSRADTTMMHSWRERSDCGERADLCSDALLAPLADVPTGTRYFWRSQNETPLHFARSTRVPGTVSAAPAECSVDRRGASLVWEQPPRGERLVVDLKEGRDGCHELTLVVDTESETSESWWLCVPFDSLQRLTPTTGKMLRIAAFEESNLFGDSIPGAGYVRLKIEIVTLGTDGSSSLDSIWVVRAGKLPAEVDFQPQFVPIEGCGQTESTCGQIVQAAELDLEQYDASVRVGESVAVGDVLPLEIYLTRAELRAVVDTGCAVDGEQGLVNSADGGASGYLEAVIVRPNEGR